LRGTNAVGAETIDLAKTKIAYVVDADNDFRDSIEMLLMAAGIEVQTFSSGEDLLSFNPPRGGCIVLDDKSNLAALKHLIRNRNGNPIVIFSELVDHSMAEIAKQSGVAAVLRKPIDHVELIALVKALLESNRVRS
jgi:FixJ family two-component response regulator